MRQDNYGVQTILQPAVEAMGYELVGVEIQRGNATGLLRVYIDSENGIDVDDCQQVSGQVSAILDVEDPLPFSYTLEVSSPGFDRPLFTLEHFQRFVGHKVKIKLDGLLEERRGVTGFIQGVNGENVVVESDARDWQIPLARIVKARLVPDY